MSDRWAVHHGDCREVMQAMEPESIDSIVSDPPYGLSFMGKGWDHGVPGVEFWEAALRVAKPGCHLLAFGGTRTFHRLTVAIEDAGWEIRDCLMWVYGSGFPKSHNLQAEWQGWGTALKPAWEPIILARKPLSGTVAANVLEHGTGAINVDGCRVGFHGEADKAAAAAAQRACQDQNKNRTAYGEFNNGPASLQPYLDGMDKGRWPANLIHDGSDEVVRLFPQAKSPAGSTIRGYGTYKTVGGASNHRPCHDSGLTRESVNGYGDSGSAARFFKCCEPDAMCCLCCLPYAEACNTIEAWKSTLASTAEKRGWTSRATSEFIARVIAIGPASEKIVPHVKSAGSLCDSCAISIAVALVATKTSAFSNEELQAILASTGNYSECILIPSLAYFAELWGSIDTIPTTNSLSLLFGSVRDAIANFTRQGTMGRAELRSAASRFAYLPKASKRDRDEGCEANHHPTVKPTDLMRYLCRLVTPPDGLVFDPFTGSGSTGKAAMLEGFRFVGAELSPEYIEIARARIGHAAGKTRQKELALA